MNVTEILIIYLTIGAPFGVRYFLARRIRSFNLSIVVKSIGLMLFWIFYVGWLFWQNSSFVQIKTFVLTFRYLLPEKKIKKVCANLESDFLFLKNSTETIAFFDFRELLERYVGLTSAIKNNAPNSQNFKHEIEIFRVASPKNSNLQLAAHILHRKNFQRLQVHQIRAQQNLLRIVNEFIIKFEFDENSKAPILLKVKQFVENFAVLANLLHDSEFENSLQNVFDGKRKYEPFVKKAEQVETNKWSFQQLKTTAALQTTITKLKTTQSQD